MVRSCCYLTTNNQNYAHNQQCREGGWLF